MGCSPGVRDLDPWPSQLVCLSPNSKPHARSRKAPCLLQAPISGINIQSLDCPPRLRLQAPGDSNIVCFRFSFLLSKRSSLRHSNRGVLKDTSNNLGNSQFLHGRARTPRCHTKTTPLILIFRGKTRVSRVGLRACGGGTPLPQPSFAPRRTKPRRRWQWLHCGPSCNAKRLKSETTNTWIACPLMPSRATWRS